MVQSAAESQFRQGSIQASRQLAELQLHDLAEHVGRKGREGHDGHACEQRRLEVLGKGGADGLGGELVGVVVVLLVLFALSEALLLHI